MDGFRTARMNFLRQLDDATSTIERGRAELRSCVDLSQSPVFDQARHDEILEHNRNVLGSLTTQLDSMTTGILDPMTLKEAYNEHQSKYLKRQEVLARMREHLRSQGIDPGPAIKVAQSQQKAAPDAGVPDKATDSTQRPSTEEGARKKENSGLVLQSTPSLSTWTDEPAKSQTWVAPRKAPLLSDLTLSFLAAAEQASASRRSTPVSAQQPRPKSEHPSRFSTQSEPESRHDGPGDFSFAREGSHPSGFESESTTDGRIISRAEYEAIPRSTRSRVPYEDLVFGLSRLMSGATAAIDNPSNRWLSRSKCEELLEGYPFQDTMLLLIRLRVLRMEKVDGQEMYCIVR